MADRARGGRGGWVAFLLLILVLGAGALYVWSNHDVLLPRLCQPFLDRAHVECEQRLGALRAEQQRPVEALLPVKPVGPTEEERRWAEVTGSLPRWPEDLSRPRDCQVALEEFRALCRELDARPHIRSLGLEGGSYAFLVKAAQDLAANPPVASGELLKHESLLANVFHLYRVLRHERTDRLRKMLTQEQRLAEPAAMVTYRWLMAQEHCSGGESRIDLPVLYGYSAFFLNTMGGQGYLRRRTPGVAALGSFYALLILDQAIQRGVNPHGVDPRPHIQSCRSILKTQDLLFRERYLAMLDEMEERWQGR